MCGQVSAQTRRRCLVVSASVLLTIVLSFAGQCAEKRPNILLIYTDDHSYRTLSCYPESPRWVRTPNIDQLAARGVRFSSAYIGTWCMPSRATLLTGHHPFGVESMRMEGTYPGCTYDSQKCPFWPKVFRERGYVTAQIGKWHTGTDTGAGRDWDYQIVWNRPRHTRNAGNYYDEQILEINGGKSELVHGYSTDNYTRWAEAFVRGEHRDPSKPWYLWLCYGAVHGPFTPADRHLAEYEGTAVPTPADIFPPRPGKPRYMQKIASWKSGENGQPVLAGDGYTTDTVASQKGLHGNTLSDWVRQYQQGVNAIDEGVGRLMKALEESGQLANTLVIFTSDQGFAWGQHGFCAKLAPYDSNIRSPLIFSMPGTLPAGKVCDAPVSGVDLPPTFFEFAGLELPWKMHGHSLLPLLKKPDLEWPHPAMTVFTGRKFGSDTKRVPTDPAELELNGVPWWVSIRQGKYKYIRTLVHMEIEEVYDMEADPEELNNIGLKPEHSNLVRELHAAAMTELLRTHAAFVTDMPRWRNPWQ